MKIRLLAPALLLSLLTPLAAESPQATSGETTELPRVELATSRGSIVLELYPESAPQTVRAFLANVASGFYDGTVFHRVIPGFMIQGGGFDPDLKLKPPPELLENEADNGLSNDRGAVAMARRGDPHSASVQFFINHVDNPGLNHRAKTDGRSWGYAVFGRVVDGMSVVDEIAAVSTERRGPMADVPVEAVLIRRAMRLDGPSAPPAITAD